MFTRRDCPTLRTSSSAPADDPAIAGVRVERTRALRSALLVARHRGQLGHVLQQDAAALQIEDAFLAPGLELAIDAFARGADEDAELLLRDVHFRAVIGSQRAQPSREANRQRLQHGFL